MYQFHTVLVLRCRVYIIYPVHTSVHLNNSCVAEYCCVSSINPHTCAVHYYATASKKLKINTNVGTSYYTGYVPCAQIARDATHIISLATSLSISFAN